MTRKPFSRYPGRMGEILGTIRATEQDVISDDWIIYGENDEVRIHGHDLYAAYCERGERGGVSQLLITAASCMAAREAVRKGFVR